MGNGIAQVCATAGLKVVMQDIAEAQLQQGMDTIAGSLDRMIKKEKISEDDKQNALSNITTAIPLESLADVDIVIEAATENESLKLQIFEQLVNAVQFCSLGEITNALFEVGGQYRRNM